MSEKIVHVAAALIVKGDQFLVAKRSAGRHLEGYWEFPGGKVENNESPAEACRREVLEELKCRISVDSFFLTCEHPYDEMNIKLDLYICHLLDGEEPELSDAHDELRFIRAAEMDTVEFAPADIDFLPKVKEFIEANNRCSQLYASLSKEQPA